MKLGGFQVGQSATVQSPFVASDPGVTRPAIGTGVGSIDLQLDLKAVASKLGLGKQGPTSSVSSQNAAALPDVATRFTAPDADAAAFARFAIDSTLATLQEGEKKKAAKEKRPAMGADQLLLRMIGREGLTHLKVALGVDENLKGKSPDEIAMRQRLSGAIVADLGQRLWSSIPIERAIRDLPRITQAFLAPQTEAAELALESRVERAQMAQKLRSFLDKVSEAAELGMPLSMSDNKLLGQADKNADADPQAAFAPVQALVQKALLFLENPPPQKLTKEELAEHKKQLKQAPPEDPKVLMAKAQVRAEALHKEVAGAPVPAELDRFRGAMIGLAIGDALGGPTEFMSREEIRHKFGMVTDMIGGGWLHLKPGEYTDDTQMAERMAESIVSKGKFDLEDLGGRFVEWLNTDPKDVGGLTRQALELKRLGVPAEQAGTIPWVMSGYENSGNGSVMRAGPVALLTAFQSPEEIDRTARASSAITHADPRATYGTAAISLATSLIIKGEDHVTDKVAKWLEDKNPVLADALKEVKHLELEELRTSGYSVHTVQAAFWALENAKSYVDGILKVSNLGEDTDTAGATAGILLGAKFGLEGIPKTWRAELQNREKLEGLAEQIYGLAKA